MVPHGVAVRGSRPVAADNADGALPAAAGLLLIMAAVTAAGAAPMAGAPRLLLGSGSLVVLLCVAAPVVLGVDRRVSPGGFVLFGGGGRFGSLSGRTHLASGPVGEDVSDQHGCPLCRDPSPVGPCRSAVVDTPDA